MPPVVIGDSNRLFHENGDVRITFDSGLQRIERTYFCASDYVTEAELILVEGYQPDDLPGFNLYPVPEKRDVCPGIVEFPCVFYGSQATRAKPKVKLTTVATTLELVGIVNQGGIVMTRTFDVLADVLTYYYAMPSQRRFKPTTPPVASLDNFKFISPRVSVVGNKIKEIIYSEEDSDEQHLNAWEWVSISSILTLFQFEDLTESPYGEWKETTVSWKASASQRLIVSGE